MNKESVINYFLKVFDVIINFYAAMLIISVVAHFAGGFSAGYIFLSVLGYAALTAIVKPELKFNDKKTTS